MSRTVGILVVYGALAAVVVAAGIAVWWRRYRNDPVRSCDLCGRSPAPWKYHDWYHCGDPRCLDQAEAEHQWAKENP